MGGPWAGHGRVYGAKGGVWRGQTGGIWGHGRIRQQDAVIKVFHRASLPLRMRTKRNISSSTSQEYGLAQACMPWHTASQVHPA